MRIDTHPLNGKHVIVVTMRISINLTAPTIEQVALSPRVHNTSRFLPVACPCQPSHDRGMLATKLTISCRLIVHGLFMAPTRLPGHLEAAENLH